MAEVEWIKIVTEFFDDDKITLIEATPEADMVLIIWIKLLCLAGKKNRAGYIYLTEKIPYTDEMLATIFHRPLNTVRLALSTFKELEMINMDAAGVIKITNWEKHQNIEGMERIREGNKIRQKRYKKQHLLALGEAEAECLYCGERNLLTIDHIIPLSKGGSDDPENKILCCLKCNMSKTNRDLVVFLNEKIDLKESININAITHNKKLMKHLKYKDNKFQRVTITPNNTIDKIRVDKIREEEEIKEVQNLISKSLGEKPKEKAKPNNIEFDQELLSWHGIDEDIINKWIEKFPDLNVNYELMMIREHFKKNPKKSEKIPNLAIYIFSWLEKARAYKIADNIG